MNLVSSGTGKRTASNHGHEFFSVMPYDLMRGQMGSYAYMQINETKSRN